MRAIQFLKHSALPLAALAALLVTALPAADVVLKRGSDQVEVLIAGAPFTTYYFSPAVAKPYLMPLRTPSGVILTRGFPVGNDIGSANPKESSFEPHQRPLYFGHGNIDGLDFWGEQAFDKYFTDHAHQAYGHMAVVKVEVEPSAARVRARFRLEDPNQRVIGEETQTYTFGGDGQTRIIDCEFVLHATVGPLVLGDTKEGTFGIRLARELSAPNDHMISSNGARGEPAIWGRPADWVAYSGAIAGKAVGIAVFDAPTSFRHPTTWHARAYGLFSANPFGRRAFSRDKNQDGSWTIPEGESITFRYRVVLYDGELPPTHLAEMYSQYSQSEGARR
ncbi:MAG: PmoA family protein [Bryobacteraceae bacterium]